jgi:RND superfamily putative drug exporter
VAVDAFIVRMTLVPAVLVLLGHRAWWLPGWLDRLLPEVDVEGAALHRKIAFETWQHDRGETAVMAHDLLVHEGAEPVELAAAPGVVTPLVAPPSIDPHRLGRTLIGREAPYSGELVVGGLLLPEQRETVLRNTTLIDLAAVSSDAELASAVRSRARLEGVSRRQRREFVERVRAHIGTQYVDGLRTPAVHAAMALAADAKVVALVGLDDLADPQHLAQAQWLAHDLAASGVAVVMVVSAAGQPAESIHDRHDHAALVAADNNPSTSEMERHHSYE